VKQNSLIAHVQAAENIKAEQLLKLMRIERSEVNFNFRHPSVSDLREDPTEHLTDNSKKAIVSEISAQEENKPENPVAVRTSKKQ
jgi:hypothetical protein